MHVLVDLDRTLAVYPPPLDQLIGPPIPKMLMRVKKMLAEGMEVRIFTARVSSLGAESLEGALRRQDDIKEARTAIEAWCLKNLGCVLPITCCKDYSTIEIHDDCAIQYIPNTGERMDGAD